MDKDKSQVEQSEYGSDSSSAGGKGSWRTALFVTLVVLAGAVAAHSVLTNGGKNSPCGWGTCAIDQGNGNGDACSKLTACPVEQAGCDAPKPACCPLEKGNGNGDSGCPKEAAAGCCPSEAVADPAPQPAPTGCCPSQAPAEPAPQPAPTGCCPGH